MEVKSSVWKHHERRTWPHYHRGVRVRFLPVGSTREGKFLITAGGGKKNRVLASGTPIAAPIVVGNGNSSFFQWLVQEQAGMLNDFCPSGPPMVFLVFWTKNAGLSCGLFSSVLAGVNEVQASLMPRPEYRGSKEKLQGTHLWGAVRISRSLVTSTFLSVSFDLFVSEMYFV